MRVAPWPREYRSREVAEFRDRSLHPFIIVVTVEIAAVTVRLIEENRERGCAGCLHLGRPGSLLSPLSVRTMISFLIIGAVGCPPSKAAIQMADPTVEMKV
jgi:hypothetical protein